MTQRKSPFRTSPVLGILALAGAYGVLGRLGLLLAIPPGYATAVWPPSGIALAGILLLGNRAWPGILLGSFLVNIWTGFDLSTSAAAVRSLFVPAGIGLGAALQAVTAAFLIRRFVGFPTPLDKETAVIKFLVLGAPLGCCVNAAIGPTTLLAAGVIPAAAYLPTWWTWWVGDTIGVLIFTPLVLILFAEPHAVWRRRLHSVALPLGMAFVAVVVLFLYVSRAEQTRIESEFRRTAESLARSVRQEVTSSMDMLTPLAAVFQAFTDVDRSAFLRAAEPLVSRGDRLLRATWSPCVPGAERELFEEAVRREAPPHFDTGEIDSQGQRVRAGSREAYMPTRFVAPEAGNEPLFGLDQSVDPARREALRQACESGSPAVTGVLTGQQVDGCAKSFAVFVPVFSGGTSPGTCDRLQGVVTGDFCMPAIVRATMAYSEHQRLGLEILDPSAPAEGRMVHRHDAGDRGGTVASQFANGSDTRVGLSEVLPVDVGSRTWTVRVSATMDYLAARQAWYPWTALACGLLFTGFLGALLLVLTGNAARVASLVSERTAELSRANAALAKEVTERIQAESRFRGLLESAPDAMVIVDGDGRIVLANRQTERLFGYSGEELLGAPVEILIPERLRVRHREHREAYMADPHPRPMGQRLELAGLCRDGAEVPVEISLSPMTTDEGLLVSSAIRDIRERKRAEAELRRRQEELAHVARVATMGAFATGLAHELNQPLCAVVSNADAACRMLESVPVGVEALRETLQDISRGAMRAGEIIRHLRDFVRKGTPEQSRLDINDMVREVGDFMQSAAREHRATIQFELAAGALPVLCDRIQLQQVLLNLVRNGLDAMTTTAPDSRLLKVRTARTRGGEVELSVQDRGVGLTPELVDQAFEPFFTTKPHGLGMGLSISRSIIEAAGGRLTGVPNPDAGTTFFLYLPGAEEGKHHEAAIHRVRRRRR